MADSPQSAPETTPPPSTAPPPPPTPEPLTPSQRNRKELTVMLVGTYFVALSALVTRRAVLRRIRWSAPTFFRQNTHHPETKVDGALEAAEALTVATVNVFSWGIFWLGGAMWAADMCGIDEIRSRLRVRLGLTDQEQTDSQEIVGEWVEAAKPWNAFKGGLTKTEVGKAKEEETGDGEVGERTGLVEGAKKLLQESKNKSEDRRTPRSREG